MRYLKLPLHLCLFLAAVCGTQALAAPAQDDFSAVARDVGPFASAIVFNAADRSFSQCYPPLGMEVVIDRDYLGLTGDLMGQNRGQHAVIHRKGTDRFQVWK